MHSRMGLHVHNGTKERRSYAQNKHLTSGGGYMKSEQRLKSN